MVALAGGSACQRSAQYPTHDGSIFVGHPGSGSAAVTVLGTEDCPGAVLALAPAEARIGESLQVSVDLVGLASGSAPRLQWFASAGSFADPAAAATVYTCPGRDQAGAQTLGVTVSTVACQLTRQVTTTCFALADGGGPAGSDARDAGPTCGAGDPTTCEGEACQQCTFDNCETLAAVNLRGGTAIAGCDIYVSDLQQQQCQRAYACMRDSACVDNSNPIRCWCGTVAPELCETGQVPGNGPCLQPIFDAAGSRDPVLVDLRLTDATFPIGGAINLATCRSVSCSVLSDPPNPVCRL
jgi:hypothetical protein